jgi:signal transduction histidine kinase
VKHVPIRIRLTLPFALGMALVLAAMGFFIYARVGSALLGSVDQTLRTQAQEIAAHTDRAGAPDRDRADAPQIAQLLASDGTVVASTPSGLGPILSGAERANVVAGRRFWKSGEIRSLDNSWRVLAFPARVRGRAGMAIVGRSLEPREEALHRLIREFLFVGPAALLIAILGGYSLAVAALRPVEAMRRRAAAITAATPGQRLPVPDARDELSRLAVTLNDMLARLEAAFEHERRFVDDASHELRTPLALLKTELEIALRHPRSRDELEQALVSAAADTDELVQLAEDLLLVARADQGDLPIRVERLAARAILEEVADRFAGDASARGRRLEVVDGGDAIFEADPARLKQALGNLMQNALVHGRGVVELDVRVRGDDVVLHVLDRGPGLSDEFRARAFDRFSRAEASRTSGGAGLGLAIVDLIARRHGARAELRPREGGGVDAVLVFRRSAQAVEPQPRRRSPAAQI